MYNKLCRGHLGEHKPGRIKPGRIKRAALSLQSRSYHILCWAKHPSTQQLPIHISGAGLPPDLQIWLSGTTPFDTTPFILLRRTVREGRPRAPNGLLPGALGQCGRIICVHNVLYTYDVVCIHVVYRHYILLHKGCEHSCRRRMESPSRQEVCRSLGLGPLPLAEPPEGQAEGRALGGRGHLGEDVPPPAALGTRPRAQRTQWSPTGPLARVEGFALHSEA